jgi:hypothetical protein
LVGVSLPDLAPLAGTMVTPAVITQPALPLSVRLRRFARILAPANPRHACPVNSVAASRRHHEASVAGTARISRDLQID